MNHIPGISTHPKDKLVIFHAGSLTIPLGTITREFNKQNPQIEVQLEPAGSRDCARKITEFGRQADLFASADYSVIEKLMMPQFANWYLNFAGNSMTILYTEKSRYSKDINDKNWWKILCKPEVEVGRSNPDADPAGYRALMVMQLAEKHYQIPDLNQQLLSNSPPQNMRAKSLELIELLETGQIDYAWEYTSVARQHHLKYVCLPAPINLSDTQFKDFYKQASVRVLDAASEKYLIQQGRPILYAVTIPTNAPSPQLAVRYLETLIGPKGRALLNADFQESLVPCGVTNPENLPSPLRRYIK